MGYSCTAPVFLEMVNFVSAQARKAHKQSLGGTTSMFL